MQVQLFVPCFVDQLYPTVAFNMVKVLEKAGWRIKGKNGAAEKLGLNPGTLYSRMKKMGIKRSE